MWFVSVSDGVLCGKLQTVDIHECDLHYIQFTMHREYGTLFSFGTSMGMK